MRVFTAGIGALALAACARGGGVADTSSTPATPAGRTAPVSSTPQPAIQVTQGTVAIVGADPATWVALRTASGVQVRVSGPAEPLLRTLSGAEVIASGGPEDGGIRAHSFTVLRVDGRAVHDGVVLLRDGVVFVRTSDGEREVPNAPRQLRQIAGARVWVTHAVAGVAPSFGVIAAAP